MTPFRVTLPSAPRLQPGFIVRPALDAALASLAPGGWLSVVAPAGFGKSQLGAYWHARACAAGEAASWGLPDDCKHGGDAAAGLCLIDSDGGDDRAHAERIARLVERRPEGLRIVTLSRTPVPADGRAPDTTIDAEALRLSLSESVALLRARTGREPEDHAAIVECEGWLPALNLLADAAFLASRSSRPGLADYLEADIMRRLDAEDRRALADLALLPDLRPAQVAAVLGRTEAEADALVARLTRQTPLFRIDSGSARLAAFARRFLRDRGREPGARTLDDIHRRAAAWLAVHEPLLAVPHLLAVDDVDQACRILGERLFDMVTGGDLSTALAWLDRIGPARISANPGLSLAAAHAYATAGHHAQATRFLSSHRADERLVLQMTLASHGDDADTAAHIMRRISDPAALGRGTAFILRNLSAWIAQKRGAWSDAENRELARLYDAEPELLLSHAYGRCRVARWEMSQGRAATAIAMLEPLLAEADDRLGRLSAPASLTASTLAFALLQAGEAARASLTLAGRRDAIESNSVASTWTTGLLSHARLAAGRGDHDDAMAILDTLDSFALSREAFSVQATVNAERMRMLVHSGSLAGTMALAGTAERLRVETRELRINGLHVRLDGLIGLGHLAIAQSNMAGARRLLTDAGLIALDLQRLIDAAEILLICPEAFTPVQQARITRTVDARDMAALRQRLGRLAGETPGADMQAGGSGVTIVDRPQASVGLTARELEMLEHLVLHRSNKMIAREIGLSGETVKWHVANLLAKLGARDRVHAVERARALGLLPSALSRPSPP